MDVSIWYYDWFFIWLWIVDFCYQFVFVGCIFVFGLIVECDFE